MLHNVVTSMVFFYLTQSGDWTRLLPDLHILSCHCGCRCVPGCASPYVEMHELFDARDDLRIAMFNFSQGIF